MELHFLGTGSAYPSPKRSASCIIFRHQHGLWMFDCGEGSQIQLQKTSLKPSRIKKIFVTHLHGDHLFGLPGLMCMIEQNNCVSEKHIDIYGPVGLSNYLRSSVQQNNKTVQQNNKTVLENNKTVQKNNKTVGQYTTK